MIKLKQIAAFVLTACSLLGSAHAITIDFTGPFDPSNWTLSNANADGSVDTSLSPNFVILTGGNNSPKVESTPGITRWSLNGGIPSSGTLDFYWGYFTSDSPTYDAAGFHYNGSDFDIAFEDGMVGHITLNDVIVGEDFGFYVSTYDNAFGPGNLVISSVSLPDSGSTFLLLGGGLVVLLGLRRRFGLAV